jgi:hypothetical protein
MNAEQRKGKRANLKGDLKRKWDSRLKGTMRNLSAKFRNVMSGKRSS